MWTDQAGHKRTFESSTDFIMVGDQIGYGTLYNADTCMAGVKVALPTLVDPEYRIRIQSRSQKESERAREAAVLCRELWSR